MVSRATEKGSASPDRVRMINMGDMGHTAVLFNPDKYVELFEQALG
jgi:hypothetical protein